MSEKSGEAKRKFEPIDPQEALSLLREAARSLSSIMIWSKLQENVVHTQLHLFSEAEQTLYATLPKDLDQRAFVEEIARSGTRDVFFSVSLPRANLFFQTPFLGFDAGIKFKVPERIFKVQRRNDFRFTLPDTVSLKAEFQDPLIPESKMEKKILDISAGGMAILVGPDEGPMFQSPLVLQGLTFSVRGRKIRCQGEVRHSSPFRQNEQLLGNKVGLLYKDMSPEDSKFIATFVTEESRKYFTQLMG